MAGPTASLQEQASSRLDKEQLMHAFLRLRRKFVPAIAGAAALAAFAVPASALAASGDTGAGGHVYLDDGTTGTNTIAAFDRQADGSLTPTPGSPFRAGGAGTGTGLA